MQLLIANRVELDSVTSYSESGTRVLSRLGRYDAVKCLLDAGADASLLDMSPLIGAVAFGNVEDVRKVLKGDALLEARDWWERTAWLVAIQTGDIGKTKLLKEAGADTGATGSCGMPAPFYAIQNHHTPMLRWLIDIGIALHFTDDFGTTCLMTAAESDNVEAIDLLLQAGVDVNEKQSQKIDLRGLPEFTSLLQGLDELLLDDSFSKKTALQYAVAPAAARRLLDAGADPLALQFEGRRALLGLPPEPDEDLLKVSTSEYRAWRSPRFGNSNPELINSPFCEGMIRAGIIAYHARQRYGDDDRKFPSPGWCAQRFGQSLTFLPNSQIVLIVDEVGYLPLDPIGATIFFQLVSARYERGSIILTSNKSYTDWGAVFGDQTIAAAILDRLLHHSTTINIRGESYRLKERKRAGLFAAVPPASMEAAPKRNVTLQEANPDASA